MITPRSRLRGGWPAAGGRPPIAHRGPLTALGVCRTARHGTLKQRYQTQEPEPAPLDRDRRLTAEGTLRGQPRPLPEHLAPVLLGVLADVGRADVASPQFLLQHPERLRLHAAAVDRD